MDSAWKRIVARFADGRQLCNCGQAYYSEGEGLNKGHMICRYGCEANILLTRDKLAEKIEALLALTHADARQEEYREVAGPTYADVHKALSNLYALATKLAAVVSATPSSAFKGWGRDPYELTRDFEAFKLPALTQARGEGEQAPTLPCEFIVGAAHFKKGVEISVLQGAAVRLYERLKNVEEAEKIMASNYAMLKEQLSDGIAAPGKDQSGTNAPVPAAAPTPAELKGEGK